MELEAAATLPRLAAVNPHAGQVAIPSASIRAIDPHENSPVASGQPLHACITGPRSSSSVETG